MLRGIHPLLTPDLLHTLASMGHGDELVVADANFPSHALGRRVVTVAGADAPAVLDAILTVFPLDTLKTPAVVTMKVTGDDAAVPEPVAAFADVLRARAPAGAAMGSLERQAFYARARDAFAVVRTGELRRFGNVILVKGVVNRYPPD